MKSFCESFACFYDPQKQTEQQQELMVKSFSQLFSPYFSQALFSLGQSFLARVRQNEAIRKV